MKGFSMVAPSLSRNSARFGIDHTPFKKQMTMLDPTPKLHQALASRGNRRRAAQAIAAAAGSLLLVEATTKHGKPLALAQEDGDDDESGRGHGGDGRDNSGPG